MKSVYVLTTNVMNGTVVVSTGCSVFPSKELAEKVSGAIERSNRGCFLPVVNHIEETVMYEDMDEVPILNNENNGNK